MRRACANELRAFALALQFLTRLPLPGANTCSAQHIAASVRYYPLVGALIGGLCAAVFWLADLWLPGLLAVLLSVAAGLAATGALHEDGLADTFDGIGASADRNRVLQVMRDSRMGTYGAVALVMALALKTAALASMAPIAVCLALVAGHGLSRLSSIVVMQTSTYVRETGAATPLAKPIGLLGWFITLVTGIVLAVGLLWLLSPVTAIIALAGLVAGHVLMRLCFERKLGGYTGDTLGAVQQASEIGLYLGVCAWP